MAKWLTKAPSDLTTLARRSGGALPTQLVWELIDGRSTTDIGPHGTREMPIWGADYRAQALRDPATAAAPEWYVRAGASWRRSTTWRVCRRSRRAGRQAAAADQFSRNTPA